MNLACMPDFLRELLRTPYTRSSQNTSSTTLVNKGKRKGQGCYAPTLTPTLCSRPRARKSYLRLTPVTSLLISAEIAKRSLVGSLLMDNSLSKEATDWREGRRL